MALWDTVCPTWLSSCAKLVSQDWWSHGILTTFQVKVYQTTSLAVAVPKNPTRAVASFSWSSRPSQPTAGILIDNTFYFWNWSIFNWTEQTYSLESVCREIFRYFSLFLKSSERGLCPIQRSIALSHNNNSTQCVKRHLLFLNLVDLYSWDLHRQHILLLENQQSTEQDKLESWKAVCIEIFRHFRIL